ncbi:MAG: oligosaccharide flippase family protein, partial [Actinomycetota bacterium]|nr:oligosaccharide flippase family protein [Actinomycetota bacterium]
MPTIARHLLRSTASNVAGQLVVLGVWFALTPFMVHRLGAANYGLWVLVASLVAYGNLLDLGVGGAVTKYVAELRARGRADEASDLIATALAMYCVVALLVVLASAPFALIFPHLFNIAPDQESNARWVVFLTGLALAVKLPTTTAYAVLRGLQRFDLNNLISVAATLVQAAAIVAVLLLGGGVVGLAAIIIPLTLLTQIPMLMVIRHVAPDLRFGLRGAQRRLVRTVASFSTSLLVINGASAVKTETDQVVIAAALPLATVAPYSLARRLSEIPGLLTYQFASVLFPLASELHGARDRTRLRALYVGSTRLTLALFVPIAVGLMVLAKPFLTAWVGERFASDADIAVILIAAGLFDVPMWPAASMLMGTNAHRPLALFAG